MRENTDQKNSEYRHFLRGVDVILYDYRTLLSYLLFTFLAILELIKNGWEEMVQL